MFRKRLNRKKTKLTGENKNILRHYLKKDWSPEQISETLKMNSVLHLSHETIYKYVWQDKADGGNLYKHLRIKFRRRHKRYGEGRRVLIPNKVSIDNRPAVVEDRSRIGDWEIDTILPARTGKDALVAMVERKSRYTLIDRIQTKDSYSTARSVIKMLAPFKKKVLTITSDNGNEFRSHEIISKMLEADYYFAHTYKAWQRGSCENTIGLIRQYYPKKMDFKNITRFELSKVTGKLNNRPRKSLNFRTPKEVFYNRNISSGVALQT
jgi:IS30 family transposase